MNWLEWALGFLPNPFTFTIPTEGITFNFQGKTYKLDYSSGTLTLSHN